MKTILRKCDGQRELALDWMCEARTGAVLETLVCLMPMDCIRASEANLKEGLDFMVGNTQFPFLTDDARCARLTSLRRAITPILANNLQSEFTDHTCDHSDEVAKLVGKLIEPVQANKGALSDRELFIVYGACYAHDAGMQYEKAGSTPTVRNVGLGETWECLSPMDRTMFLRDHHHEISADMVFQSVRSSAPPLGISLEDSDDPALIAALCKAHILDVGSREYLELMNGGGPAIRMDLLSGLLRMADILEESRRRANRPKAETLLLPLLSRAHWWRHYYTRDVAFDADEKSVTLVFDFPRSRRDEYGRIVPQLHLPNIQAELRRHDGAFAKCGVTWVIKPQIDQSVYGTAEEMPVDVEAKMLGMLKDQADRDVVERRRHVTDAFEQARPLIGRLLADIDRLPAATTPREKAGKLEGAADAMHQISAFNGEASVLMSAFRLWEQAGDVQKQLGIGLRLIPLLRTQDAGYAHAVLTECERLAEATRASSGQRLELLALKAHILDDLGAFAEMADAYRTASQVAAAEGRKSLADQLTADLAEVLYLVGDMEEAAKAVANFIDGAQAAFEDVEDLPSPAARMYALDALVHARSGGATDSLRHLSIALARCADQPKATRSRALLLNTKAHVLFLTGAADAAGEALSEALDEIAFSDHPSLRIALERNRRSCFSIASVPDRLRQHDEVRDAANVVGRGQDYAISVLSALDDQRNAKHVDAFQALWRELRESYRSGNWQRYREAESYFAIECVHLGTDGQEVAGAVYHAIQSLSADLVHQFSEALLDARRPDPIREALTFATSNLTRLHAIPACELIRVLADAVPDDFVASAFDYLLPLATCELEFLAQADVARPAWRALATIGGRLDPQRSMALLTHIAGLDWDHMDGLLRQLVLKAIRPLTPSLPRTGLELAAQVALSQTVGYPKNLEHQVYYAEALDVLHSVGLRSGDELKEFIKQGLFPPGVPQADARKLMLLPLFGKDLAKGLEVNKYVGWVVRMVEAQVQEYDAGEPQESPLAGAAIQQSHDLGNGRLRVTRMMPAEILQVAISYLDLLDEEMTDLLLTACLNMVAAPHNFLSNRLAMIQLLSQAAGNLTAAQRSNLRQVLIPLARGEGVSDAERQRAQDAQNPLNRFRINLGAPVQLQGMALRGLAHLQQADAEQPQGHGLGHDPAVHCFSRSDPAPRGGIRYDGLA